MKKRIISMITASLLAAVAAFTLAACGDTNTPASNDRSIGAVATAYSFVHGSYVGESTVTVDKDGEVLWIDFAEWLLPDRYSSYTVAAIEAAAVGADTTIGDVIGTQELEMPSNFTVVGATFTAGTAALKAKLAISIGPEFIRIGNKFYAARPTTEVNDFQLTAKVNATFKTGYFEITGKNAEGPTFAAKDLMSLITRVDGAYPTTATKELAEFYAKAARAGDIAFVEEATSSTAGARVAPDGTSFKDVTPSTAAPTGVYKGEASAKAAAGLWIPNKTFNKMDKENTYWPATTGENARPADSFKKNVNAMREFFIANGLDFDADDFKKSDVTEGYLTAEKAWSLTSDNSVKIGLNDGTAYATLTDFVDYFNVMKAAYTAAKAQLA